MSGGWNKQIEYTRRVYSAEGASPTLTTQSEGVWGVKILVDEGEKMECKQIATLEGERWDGRIDYMKRVYSPDAASPALATVSGGGYGVKNP